MRVGESAAFRIGLRCRSGVGSFCVALHRALVACRIKIKEAQDVYE